VTRDAPADLVDVEEVLEELAPVFAGPEVETPVPVPVPVFGVDAVVRVAGELLLEPVGVEPEEPVAGAAPVEGETESELVLQLVVEGWTETGADCDVAPVLSLRLKTIEVPCGKLTSQEAELPANVPKVRMAAPVGSPPGTMDK